MFSKYVRQAVAALALCLILPSAHAASGVFEFGVYGGGDKLAGATFTNGSSESIHAGGLLDLSVGVRFDVADNLETQFTIGYRFDSIDATNGSIEWTRVPLEGKIFYLADDFRIGGGFTYHLNPTLEGDGVATSKFDFDNATGFVFEVDYLGWQQVFLGLKLTSIDYEVDNITVDGNSTGLIVGFRF